MKVIPADTVGRQAHHPESRQGGIGGDSSPTLYAGFYLPRAGQSGMTTK